MSDILFIKTSSLGDIVHQMPAITDAGRDRPDRRLVWVVEEPFVPLARLHPGVTEVIPVATRRWRARPFSPVIWREVAAFRSRLRERSYDRIIDTQGLIRSALIARGARGQRHGYDSRSIREPMAARLYDVAHAVARDCHAVVRNRTLTALSLGQQMPAELDYGLSRPDGEPASRYAVLLHGTSRPQKEWREADWIQLGQWLQRRGLEILLPWGSQDERLRSVRLASAVPNSRVIARQSLDTLAGIIARAAIVVGVDTGLLHLAAAYRVPVVANFLSTDPKLTGPIGNGPIAVVGGCGNYPALAGVIGAAERMLG